MCLNTIDTKTKKGNGVGYKVFRKAKDYHILPRYRGSTRYKCNVWYEDKNKKPIASEQGSPYKPGYHIYLNYRDAARNSWGNEVVRRVEYQDVVVSGKQAGDVVIVARKKLIHTAKETKEALNEHANNSEDR